MLQHQRIFELSQLASLPDDEHKDGDRIVDWSLATESDIVVFLTERSCDIFAVALNDSGDDHGYHDPSRDPSRDPLREETEGDTSIRSLKWYEDPDLRPVCLSFSPGEDYAVVATHDGSLFVVPVQLLVQNYAPGCGKGDTCAQKAWGTSSITRLLHPEKRPRNVSEHRRRTPSSVLWYTTRDLSRSFAIIGTRLGHLYAVDLVTGREIGCVSAAPTAIVRLEILSDSALDSTYLLISVENGGQRRLLFEQRSTAYVWGISDSATSVSAASTDMGSIASEEVQGLSRSRLSGLKQISVAGLANLRQRISDGRKLMLDRSRGGATPNHRSTNFNSATPNVEVAEEAVEHPTEDNQSKLPKPESLKPKVGDARLSVQRSAADLHILAGVFPETAILTVHNCDLEVVPQSAFKLPRGADRILILNKVMVISSVSGDLGRRKHALHIVSAFHSELHLDGSNTKSDAVLQSFHFPPGEVVTAIVERRRSVIRVHDVGKQVVQSAAGPEAVASQIESTISPSRDESPGKDFFRRMNERVAVSRLKGRNVVGQCFVVTSRGLYLLHLDQDPVTTFVELAGRGGSEARRSERLALAFGLDAKGLLELSGDIRLCERDFSNAISLYRMAGCKHLKVVLKFAASGNVQELLSYLNVLFKTPNLEVTPAERIHLSNLALMAYFQQALTKSTPTTRANFQSQIRHFLDDNAWFDDCLAVRMATETRQWDLLGHVARTRGISHEMVDAVTAVMTKKVGGETTSLKDLTKTLQEMSSAERNSLLACLLSPSNVEAVAASPMVLGRRLLMVLGSSLPLLEEQGLRSVLSQCSPGNPGLRPLYLPLLRQQAKEESGKGERETRGGEDDFAAMLLNLFITASLMLLKKTGASRSMAVGMPLRYLRMEDNGADPETGGKRSKSKERYLATAATHVLMRRKDALVSWGSSAHGVLGNGPTGSRFGTPSVVSHFAALNIRVISVACGKSHSLALTDNGLYTWGSSKHGQLGLGRHNVAEQRPVLICALADTVISAIAAGQYHSVALDEEGHVWTWGWGVHGQLGSRDIEDVFEPARVITRTTDRVTQIDAGYAHTLLLTEKGDVWTFGCGLFGQMGNGDNKKVTRPVKVNGLPGPVRLISAGFFHNVAIDEEENVYTWGCNPQILRLEAQQKKRERLQTIRKEMERQHQQQEESEKNDAVKDAPSSLFKDLRRTARQAISGSDKNSENNSSEIPVDVPHVNGAEEKGSSSQPMSLVAPPVEDENDMLHLVPGLLCRGRDAFGSGGGRVVQVACGNQHSMFLTDRGILYTQGRSADGQLGNNSRKESKLPTAVSALKDDFVRHIAAGADYSVAVAESGTVFAWGSNAGGQLGKPPMDEGNGDGPNGGGKVVVMKTTRRIIRLQNNLQNTCDVPKPVPNIGRGVYSNAIEDDDESADLPATKLEVNIVLSRRFAAVSDPETLLHLALESFHGRLDAQKLVKKCLVSDNAGAAAKISLLAGNVLQAFEFTLQLNIRSKSPPLGGAGGNAIGERLFSSFFFYLMETRSLPENGAAGKGSEHLVQKASVVRRQLLERLIACWQDQKFSFVLLENLFVKNSDPLLLQTLVLTLFCPEEEEDAESPGRIPDGGGKASKPKGHGGPMGGDGFSGPRAVDLFTPEFCLKIGDTFVKEFKESGGGSEGRRASAAAGEWLLKLKKGDADQI